MSHDDGSSGTEGSLPATYGWSSTARERVYSGYRSSGPIDDPLWPRFRASARHTPS